MGASSVNGSASGNDAAPRALTKQRHPPVAAPDSDQDEQRPIKGGSVHTQAIRAIRHKPRRREQVT